MIIQLNGFNEEIPDNLTISDLIERFQEGDPHLMVEVNRRYIFPKAYDQTRVRENDIVEFINPDLGG